jgi:ABC-type multidrug transport system ATPase subunit
MENLLFAGKFRLPRGTSSEEIRMIAEEILSRLGLARVAQSLVGNVSKRGISGGEKKRLNIGVEMMAKPSILFLDEPTSGLDANCALHVMKALKVLVQNHGVTVCSAIHQPRKFIFELFDSLILLGSGGRIIYHGPTLGAAQYFLNLKYCLPPSESVADWLLDISSGYLLSVDQSKELTPDTDSRASEAIAHLFEQWERHLQSLVPDDLTLYSAPETSPLPLKRVKLPYFGQLMHHICRNFLGKMNIILSGSCVYFR